MKAEALQALSDLKERSLRRHDDLYYVAAHYFELADRDHGFKWLEKACYECSPLMHTIKVDPLYDNIHSDPRFQDLLHRMNFPE